MINKDLLGRNCRDHIVLAGGGHSHALILLRWAMKPQLRPKGLITLVSRYSTTLYSGMIPGLISGKYKRDEVLINLRVLAERAKVAFIVAEITGLDIGDDLVILRDRPPITYTRISLDIGAETFMDKSLYELSKNNECMPIRPLEKALNWISKQDHEEVQNSSLTFNVIGAGLAGVEIALALRRRWARRPLLLHAHPDQPSPKLKQALVDSRIGLSISKIIQDIEGPALLCTGSQAPDWLAKSGLSTNLLGRVFTTSTLQALNHPNIFAVGDCGVLRDNFRAASGVWAVRAAKPLAKNLELSIQGLKPISWTPQRSALQIIGGHSRSGEILAWALLWGIVIGPHALLWRWKEAIDRRFIAKFDFASNRRDKNKDLLETMDCRGCAAKLPAKPLKDSLKRAELTSLAEKPEDSALITSSLKGETFIQSIDGFPALVSDPWMNARLTTLHACSDIWASGASVLSAQSLITLPAVSERLQKELLTQILSGIKSALEPQGATLIGGHTMEARNSPIEPISLDVQIGLSVNGFLQVGRSAWTKSGVEEGDVLLISRGLGSGVLFAAKIAGRTSHYDLDSALADLSVSQHELVSSIWQLEGRSLESNVIHACTDITGFGLLGHIGEMIESTNLLRLRDGLSKLKAILIADNIPHLRGSLSLLNDGFFSTLAPANRNSFKLLEPSEGSSAVVELKSDSITFGSKKYHSILELVVDPQTCGPLLLSCAPNAAKELLESGPWIKIGNVEEA